MLNEDNDDPDLPEYELELDRPYGTYKIQAFYREKEPQANGEPQEMKALTDEILTYLRDHCTPEPISEKEQKELDDQEEKDNKEKERQARKAQKELESKKARQKAEAQMQLLK